MKKLENLPDSVSLIPVSNVFVIDWLTVSFLDMSPALLKCMLGLSDKEWCDKQAFTNGYPADTFFANIHIWYGADVPQFYTSGFNKNGHFVTAEMKARYDMGICLNMSGQGCRAFEEYSSVGWKSLFEMIKKHNGHVTRLDLAYDDHIGVIDLRRFACDIRDRNYISKAKWADIMWSDDQLLDVEGLSVYIGKRSSDVLIRVYDKAAERGYADRHWVRLELQLRRDRAGAALDHLLESECIGPVVAGILKNYLTVCVPSADTNKSRWEVAYYWQRIIGNLESIRLWSAPGEPYNFHRTESHLIKQYCQFLLTFYEMYGNMQDLLIAARQHHGNKPLKDKYVNAITEYFARMDKKDRGLHFTNETFNLLYEDDPDCPFNTTKN